MSQPFRNIPKEFARTGRETLLATVAEADDHVWCSTVSGRLVLMKPLTKLDAPHIAMTKGPSTRALQSRNILMDAGEIEQFVDQSMKDMITANDQIVGREPWPGRQTMDQVKGRRNQLLYTTTQIAFHSDLHPEGQQAKLMARIAQNTGYQFIANQLNRELLMDTRHTVHNLMHMDPKVLGTLMSEGLNVQNLDKASQHSIHPHDLKPLHQHMERHLGYALQANLDSDANCLVCGCDGYTMMPKREHLVFLEDFSPSAQEAALRFIGCEPSYYENAKNTLEASGLEPRSDEFQSALFQLVKEHVQGQEIEAFELPDDLIPSFVSGHVDYESALTKAHQVAMSQKDQDRDR